MSRNIVVSQPRWTFLIPFGLALLVLGSFVVGRAVIECNSRVVGCYKANVGALTREMPALKVDTLGSLADLDPQAQPGDRVRAARIAVAAQRYTGRIIWAFFVGVSVLTTLAAPAIAWFTLRRAPGEPAGPLRVQLSIIAALYLVVLLLSLAFPEMHMNLMLDVLKETVSGAAESGGVKGAANIIVGIVSFEQAGSLALVLACSLLLWPSRILDDEPSNDPETLLERELRPTLQRLKNLRVFLYGATILLVVGVIRMQSTGSWVLTFLHPTEAAALAPLFQALSWVMGAFFSLILTAVYLPTAHLLRARAASIIARSGADTEFKESLAAKGGMSEPMNSSITRIAALLGPLLAGPIGQLLTAVAK